MAIAVMIDGDSVVTEPPRTRSFSTFRSVLTDMVIADMRAVTDLVAAEPLPPRSCASVAGAAVAEVYRRRTRTADAVLRSSGGWEFF